MYNWLALLEPERHVWPWQRVVANYSQIILGPGPSKAIVAKAIDTLDYHKSQKCFYQDRKLYAKQMKPLTPEKQQPKQSEKATNCIDSKVKSAVDSLEEKNESKTPVKPTVASQAKKSSANTAPTNKHKQSLASGHSRK